MIFIYSLKDCSYCKKVINLLNEKNIEYKNLDISEDIYKQELIHIGGKEQVPFLMDTDKKISMYESNDIINYIETI